MENLSSDCHQSLLNILILSEATKIDDESDTIVASYFAQSSTASSDKKGSKVLNPIWPTK